MSLAARLKLNTPRALASRPQWVMWRLETRENGETTKVPYQPSGRRAAANRPHEWSTYEACLAVLQDTHYYNGIGYVLAEDDPNTGVDLDHCRNPETGEILPEALEIVRALNSYTEISPSGKGLRIFLEGRIPDDILRNGRGRRAQLGSFNVEIYSALRFLTHTGDMLPDTPDDLHERQLELTQLCRQLFPPEPQKAAPVRASGGALQMTDTELLRTMFAGANGAAILALWNGDTSAHGGDDSRADLALCSHLMFYAGNDEARVDALFRQSRLYREKWDREDYRNSTLGMARAAEVYSGPAQLVDLSGLAGGAEGPAEDQLADDRALLDRLPDLMAADPGCVFQLEILAALGRLRAFSAADWFRAKELLRKHRVLRDVERVLPAPSTFLPRNAESVSGVRVGDLLPSAPCPELVIPEPYTLTDEAVWIKLVDEKDGTAGRRQIAPAPVIVTARLMNQEEGTASLRLSWSRGNNIWEHHVASRRTAVDASRLVELADRGGFPVGSANARDLATWLDRFETINFLRLRTASVSSHLGWQGQKGEHGFLWGRRLILPTGEVTDPIQLDRIEPELWRPEWVSFQGATAGDNQIADSYHAAGSMAGWVAAVSPVARYPRVALALYVALTAPLLMILGAGNPIVDWANRTSTGKTMSLRIGASCWGKPDEKAADGALSTWDNTQVWVERASHVLSGLPLILDDTKRAAKRPQVIADVLYAVASGRGRGRGTTRGLAATRTWRTCLLSNGEAPATSFTQDGGTRARVLVIRGVPFIRDNNETRRVVESIGIGITANYGHAGPAVVRWLMANRHRWDDFRAEFRAGIERYAVLADSNVGGRMAEFASAIDLTAAIAHAALDLPWDYQDPLATLWQDIVADAADASGEVRALRDVMSWCYAHPAQFFGQSAALFSTDKQPIGGWAGAWSDASDWDRICILRSTLDQLLKTCGYEPEAILHGWKEREWLITDGRNIEAKFSLAGQRPRGICIRRSAIEAADA